MWNWYLKCLSRSHIMYKGFFLLFVFILNLSVEQDIMFLFNFCNSTSIIKKSIRLSMSSKQEHDINNQSKEEVPYFTYVNFEKIKKGRKNFKLKKIEQLHLFMVYKVPIIIFCFLGLFAKSFP